MVLSKFVIGRFSIVELSKKIVKLRSLYMLVSFTIFDISKLHMHDFLFNIMSEPVSARACASSLLVQILQYFDNCFLL